MRSLSAAARAFAGLLALSLLAACRSAVAPPAPAARPPESGCVVGEVRTPDGSPVPDAWVAAFGEDMSYWLAVDPHWWTPLEPWEEMHAGRTGPDGRFRLEGLQLGGKYFVVAAAKGWVGSEAVRGLFVNDRRHTVTANPILRRGGRLEVALVDPDGAPVTGATVTHVVMGMRRPQETEIREGPEPGVFRLETLPPETVYLTVGAEGWAETTLHYEPGGPESRRELVRLDRGATLRGKVVDEGGAPVRDGWVHLWKEGDEWPIFQRQPVRAEPDGSFEILHLPSGVYSVYGSAFSGGMTESASVEVPREDLVLRIASRPGQVQFHLQPPAGYAAPKVLYRGFGTTHNWRNGYFEIDVDSPGSGVLHFFPPGFAPFSLEYTVAERETVDLGDHVLDPGVPFEGLVVDPGGRPVEGATAWLVQRQSQGDPRATTGSDGVFRLEHLARGANSIRLSKEGFIDSEVEVLGEGDGSRRFVLARGGIIRIRVLDASGGPGAGTFVIAKSGKGPEAKEAWRGGVDVRGRTEVRLPAGQWTMEVWGAETRTVTLAEGGTAEVVLRLK